MKKTILILTTVALLSFKADETSKWNLDNAHAKVGFTVTHLMMSDVDGYFKTVTASVTSSNADFTDAVAEMTAQVNSVSTDNEKRDGHLQNADFFDAVKFPTITFKSVSFKKTATANNYTVTGNLTMHGITKPVTLNAFARTGINPMNQKITTGFKITGEINRKDFGVGASTPDAIVSEKITLTANAEFIKEISN
ncbi:MAG: YceI family protein [Bacteroidota bacterium]